VILSARVRIPTKLGRPANHERAVRALPKATVTKLEGEMERMVRGRMAEPASSIDVAAVMVFAVGCGGGGSPTKVCASGMSVACTCTDGT
jgi:hypothetical protein